MVTWDRTVDVLAARAGGAGLASAMSAADAGLTVVVVESTDRWGGSTSMSGGGIWLPANPLMARDGADDTREDGEVVGAATELMEDAWWGASIPAPSPDASPSFLVGERSFPYWMICDARHTHRSLRSFAIEPGALSSLRDAGLMPVARTVRELAELIGIDPASTRTTAGVSPSATATTATHSCARTPTSGH